MENKTIIKRKLNIKKILISILILFIVFFLIFILLTKKIENIFIYNNTLLSDQEIIDISKLRNYPNYIFKTKVSIKNDLLENKFIKSVEIKKRKFKEIHIYIEEYRPLFINSNNSKTVMSNSDEVLLNLNLPILINEIEEQYYIKLVEKMNLLTNEVLFKISEIKYDPNNIDKERILLTMNDGNYVYLTLLTFEKINNYNNILPTLEGKRGILYLDSGNYFEILK
ncbi:MAG: FtsQ-type POTRA domain-containing protein [Bacilli bacterium]|nr:FtsQ-type POTRA domain-containing protein [Bacilli bacterium]